MNSISRVDNPLFVTGSAAGLTPAINPRWVPVPITELNEVEEEIQSLWKGFLVPGGITSFTALWKSGKTTLVSHLLKALDGSATEFLGQPVRSAKVLLVTEENRLLWQQRRDDLGIGGHVDTLCKPFLVRPTPTEWLEFMKLLASLQAEHRYDLVVFDTIHNLWCVKKEEDAPQTLEALTPMYMLTEQGAAVLLLFHPTKSDTSEGRLTRGTGAIGGLVDIIVEMRRFDAERREDTRRVVTSYSRFEDSPPELVIELDKETNTYIVVGTKAEATAADRLDTILALLPSEPPGLTVNELYKRWPDLNSQAAGAGDTPVAPKPTSRTIHRDLRGPVKQGLVQTTGAGTRGNPARFYAPIVS